VVFQGEIFTVGQSMLLFVLKSEEQNFRERVMGRVGARPCCCPISVELPDAAISSILGNWGREID